jgi:hypothetical protein
MAEFRVRTQSFPAADAGDVDIAQRLVDSGLMFLVNEGVLHRHGLALAAEMKNGEVVGLALWQCDDPDGLWFDEDTLVDGRRKLRAAGLR